MKLQNQMYFTILNRSGISRVPTDWLLIFYFPIGSREAGGAHVEMET